MMIRRPIEVVLARELCLAIMVVALSLVVFTAVVMPR
jgi:hypothetical protein